MEEVVEVIDDGGSSCGGGVGEKGFFEGDEGVGVVFGFFWSCVDLEWSCGFCGVVGELVFFCLIFFWCVFFWVVLVCMVLRI